MHRPFLSPIGTRLGIATSLISASLDQEQTVFPNGEDYARAWTMVLFNLLCLGPFVYARVQSRVSLPKTLCKTVRDVVALVLVHSGVYTLAHRCMHRIAAVRPIHKAHHVYKEVVVPSVANAVSASEFLFAYMMPFVLGVYAIRPSQDSLVAATVVVSLANLVVHSPHLKSVQLHPILVSPSAHLAHHMERSKFYSAPTFNIEYICTQIVKRLSHIGRGVSNLCRGCNGLFR